MFFTSRRVSVLEKTMPSVFNTSTMAQFFPINGPPGWGIIYGYMMYMLYSSQKVLCTNAAF